MISASGRVLLLEDILLLGTAICLPWALGGAPMWAYRPAGALLVAAAAVAVARRGWDGLGIGRDSSWLLPSFLLIAWAALQLVPLPPAVLATASPQADRIFRETIPGYPGSRAADPVPAIESSALSLVPEVESGALRNPDAAPFRPQVRGRWTGWRSLSLQPSATLERLSWYTALLLAFLVARRRLLDSRTYVVYRNALFVLFAVLAAQGLAQAATGEGRIFWRISVSEAGRVFGPYIDPTHFAGVMELAVPWLVGYVLSRERSEGWQALARPKAALAAGAAILCFVAGLATASKMAAALLVMSSVALFLVRAHGTRQRLAVLVGAAVLLPLAALAVSQTHLGERVAEFVVTRGQMSGSDRVVGWRTALSVLADFPLTGTGFGTFRQVFPRYLPAGESSQWQQLHNDYLEVLLDGGLIAGALIGWLAWGYGRRALALLRSGRGIRSHLSRCGALYGVIALSLHALVEFNHQMPANALLFVVVAAAAVTPRAGNAERVS